MKRYWVILLGVFIWGFLVTPNGAVADTSHTGAHVHSPFDAPKGKKSLHCQLLGHHHSALLFCPHTMQDRSAQTQLKADCGDHSSGTPVQIQWSKTLMLYPSIGRTPFAVKKYHFTSKQFRWLTPFHDRLEKPPQHA